MPRARTMTDEAFEQLALDDPDGKWELWCGVPRRKPAMTFEHNDIAELLSYLFQSQLDRGAYRVRSDKGHVRCPTQSYYIPDFFVIPASAFEPQRGHPERLEAYLEPLPLVVEIWSRSTGGYDQREKLGEYKRRSDLEIWLIHPYERTLTAWRHRPDGSYTETVYHGGAIQPVTLPNVTIPLDELFD